MSDQFPPLGTKAPKKNYNNSNNNNNNNNTNNNNNNNNNNSGNNIKYKNTTNTSTTNNNVEIRTRNEIVDIGANLADKQFVNDVDQVLERSYKTGVSRIVITGTSINSSNRSFELIKKMKQSGKCQVELYSTCGVHPHDAENTMRINGGGEKAVNILKEMIKSNLDIVKAVGECGLDFNRNFSSHETQIEMFQRQIQIGIDYKLPLFIHERDAHVKLMEVVKPYLEKGTMPKSVVHCFTGTADEAKTYIDNGFYIGFTGFISHNTRGKDLRDILSKGVIPLEKIMIETDAPYMNYYKIEPKDMPPKSPHTKGRCEPSFLPYILKTLSECYNLPEKDIAEITLKNSKSFFSI